MLGKHSIFLIGPMGSGKTAVAKCLARLLDYPFYDSDLEIESRSGADIPLIFEREGEVGFRRRERDIIAELTARPRIVLATGGGAVLRDDTRERLRNRGLVIYLRANPHDLWQRTRRDKNRPLLQTEDPRRRLETLFAERDPLYSECAHIVIETGRPSINNLVNTVVGHLETSSVRSGCTS